MVEDVLGIAQALEVTSLGVVRATPRNTICCGKLDAESSDGWISKEVDMRIRVLRVIPSYTVYIVSCTLGYLI